MANINGRGVLRGTALADNITGGNGRDTLFGAGGDDALNGGNGTDTAVYGGNRADYLVTPGAGVFTIADIRQGGDGIDTVQDVEVFIFRDGSVSAGNLLSGSVVALPGRSSAAVQGFGPGAGGWLNNDRFPREMADVNGDGLADIVGFAGNGVFVSLANGTGGFNAPSRTLIGFGADADAGGWASSSRYPRTLEDVNGDGSADIIGFGQNGVFVALADGTGGFNGANLVLPAFGFGSGAGGWESSARYPREVADVNGDGRGDIIGFAEGGVFVALADGMGGFASPSLALQAFGAGGAAGGWANSGRYPREVADVNGDGLADVIGFAEDGVYVALANGGIPAAGLDPANGGGDAPNPAPNPAFTFASPILALQGFGAGPSAGGWENNGRYPRQVADVNGDGRADLVGFGEGGAFVALADGTGRFSAPILGFQGFGAGPGAGGWTNAGDYPRELADVNGDARADIVGFGHGGVFTAYGTASGEFI